MLLKTLVYSHCWYKNNVHQDWIEFLKKKKKKIQFTVRRHCSMKYTASDIYGNIDCICQRLWHDHARLVQKTITVCTHNPPLHLSHLQPFISTTRQESIHLSLSFATHTSLCRTHAHINILLDFISVTSFSSHLHSVCHFLFLSPFFFPLTLWACTISPLFFFLHFLVQQCLTAHCGSGRIKVPNPRDVS